MKHPFKLALATAVALLSLHGNRLEAAENNVGLREEASTLENIYQEKAHTTLDALMNQEDYTVVVSATIKNDEAKLKEYHSLVEKKFLPGMALNDPAGFGEEHNILHALKQKVEIQVILNDRVPGDRDNLVKEILKSKLKLNEEGGDTIAVVRASHTNGIENVTKKLPELSGKMILFLLILASLAIAGIAMWLYKRHEEKLAEAEARGAQIVERERLKDAIKEENGELGKVEVDTNKTPEEIALEQRLLEQKIIQGREELVSLSHQHSRIVDQAIEEFVADGKLEETTLVLECIGWEESRKLFKGISNKLWARVAANLRDRKQDPSRADVQNAIHVFKRFALSFVLEKAGNNFENPFSFIFSLNHSQKMDLFQSESAYNIALISIYSTGAQMGDLISGLSAEKQNEIFFNITKIKHLPESEVNNSINALVTRLEGIKKAPSIHVDGLGLAAKFVRSLDPVKEEALIQNMKAEHPEEHERLRRTQVMFADIPIYPTEYMKGVIDSLESDDVLKALAGYPEQFVESFLGMLPTKKALMIQNDLFHMADKPAPSQSATARRKIVDLIEGEFERTKFSVTDFWNTKQVQPTVENTQFADVTQSFDTNSTPVEASQTVTSTESVSIVDSADAPLSNELPQQFEVRKKTEVIETTEVVDISTGRMKLSQGANQGAQTIKPSDEDDGSDRESA